MSEKYNLRTDPTPKITEEAVEKLLNNTNYTKQQLKNIALLLLKRLNNDNPDEYNQQNDPYPRTTHHAVFELWVDDNMEMNEKIASILLKSVDEDSEPKDIGNVQLDALERLAVKKVKEHWNDVDTMPMRKNIALLLLKSVIEGNLIDGKSLPRISSYPEPKNPKKPTAEDKRLITEWSLGQADDISSKESDELF